MKDHPINCKFLICNDGRIFRVAICSNLQIPLTVHLHVEPALPSNIPATTVAVWRRDQWYIYEGDENSDPREWIARALHQSELPQGTSQPEWSVIKQFLRNISQSRKIWRC